MISKEEIKHIAGLARLGLSEKEMEKMRKEVSAILGYVEKLKEVKVEKVKPTTHAIEMENVFREDKADKQPEETTAKLIKAAPDKKGRHIKVKAVL